MFAQGLGNTKKWYSMHKATATTKSLKVWGSNHVTRFTNHTLEVKRSTLWQTYQVACHMINNGLIKTKISVTNTIVNLKANTLKMIMNFRRPNTSSFHSHIQQRCTLCWKKIQHTVCCTQEVWVYSDTKQIQLKKLWFRSWIITFSIIVTSLFLFVKNQNGVKLSDCPPGCFLKPESMYLMLYCYDWLCKLLDSCVTFWTF